MRNNLKVIGRSIWDKTVFVMCDCHAELIQFTKTLQKKAVDFSHVMNFAEIL